MSSQDKRGNTAMMWAIRNDDEERALDCCKVL
eukprot:SAG11_NODE_9291_length_925_cov_1.119855_2_plen_31_part_01